MATTFKFKADGSGYARGLERMREQTKQFSSNVGGLLKGAFAYIGVSSFKSLLNEMAEIERASKRIGISSTEFQKISNAAKTLGVDSEAVADAIKDLNVKITDGATGAKSYAEMFALIGLSLEDVKNMKADEQFYAFADAIKAAGGNLSRFGADEISDAMYRLNPLLKLGAEEIKRLGEEMGIFSSESTKNASEGLIQFAKLLTEIKVTAGETYSRFAKLAHIIDKLGPKFGSPSPEDLARDKDRFNKPLKERIKGALKGPEEGGEEAAGKAVEDQQKAIEEALAAGKAAAKEKEASLKKEAELLKQIAEKRMRIAEEQQKASFIGATAQQKLNVITKQRMDKERELALFRDDFNNSSDHTNAILARELEIKKLITKETELQQRAEADRAASLDKIKGQHKDIASIQEEITGIVSAREDEDLTLDEKREKSLEKIKKLQEELAKINKDARADGKVSADEAIKAWNKKLEIERAISDEKRMQDRIDAKAAAEKKKDDDAREDAASTREQIAQERRDREEIGMDEGQIIARRQQELRAAQAEQEALRKKAQSDGTVTGLEDKELAEGQLAIENLKTEIANLQSGAAGAEPEPETAPNIIASSLAAIAGGGGAAMFTADPLLSENKKQTRALEGILGALGGTEDGGTINNPEL